MAEVTKGRFGFHRGGSEHEPPTAAYIQIYVKSSTLSRSPDLAISAHLTTEAEIDEFVDDALAELERVRNDAKKELAAASLAALRKRIKCLGNSPSESERKARPNELLLVPKTRSLRL